MSATLKVVLTFPGLSSAQLVRFEGSDDSVSSLLDKLAGRARDSFHASGTRTTAVLSVLENGTRATATVTCITVGNNATVTVGNVVLTGKTSAPSGQAQWLCGVSAGADALALATCINAHSTLSTWVSAANVSGVMTITALDYDTRANAYALTSSDGTNLAVTAFSGGVADASSITVKP